jgi:hypothetical protein
MRCITKQNIIRKMRLKFVQIVTLQDKALATKRPEMRDGRLASKAKLKEVSNSRSSVEKFDWRYNM